MAITVTDDEDTKEIDRLVHEAYRNVSKALMVADKYRRIDSTHWTAIYFLLDGLYKDIIQTSGLIASNGRLQREKDPYNDGS